MKFANGVPEAAGPKQVSYSAGPPATIARMRSTTPGCQGTPSHQQRRQDPLKPPAPYARTVLITAGGCLNLCLRSRLLDYPKQPAAKGDCRGLAAGS